MKRVRWREVRALLPTRGIQINNIKKHPQEDVFWCRGGDLNSRHKDFQSFALPLSYLGITFFPFLHFEVANQIKFINILGPLLYPQTTSA